MNPNDARTLVDQVADGLRAAITGGWYRPGDAVPPSRDLAPLLGVSRRVTKTALARLAGEGLIMSRPRIGSIVRDRSAKRWKGNVLFVSRSNGDGYYDNVFAATLRSAFVMADWLLTSVAVGKNHDGSSDTSELEIRLTGPVTLAVVLFRNPAAERVLSRSGVPFVTMDERKSCRANGCVGHVRYDSTAAASELARYAVDIGLKTVLQTEFNGKDDIYTAFKAQGLKMSRWNIPFPRATWKGPETAWQFVKEEFLAWLAKHRSRLPDMIFFSDDFACAGALAAFAAAGVRVPETVRVATWVNAGNCPAFAKELSRLEINPRSDAEKVAAAILAYLDNRSNSVSLMLGPTFKKGGTL